MSNSEAGRISNLLQKAQRCAVNENLAKARAYVGTKACCKTPTVNNNTPLESDYLVSSLGCYTYVKPPVPTQSVRISRLIQATLAAQTNSSNPDIRFSHYAPTPVVPPCPPTVFSGPVRALGCTNLLNTPLTPSLPV